MNTMSAHPDVPPLPPAYQREFARLSDRIQEWELNPSFRVGDVVRHRPRFIGGRTGGVVRRFLWKGCHLCAEVDFGGGKVERFQHGEYMK